MKTTTRLFCNALFDGLLDTGVVTAPENTAKVHAFTLFVDYSGSGIAQGVYLDDLVLCTLDQNGDSNCR